MRFMNLKLGHKYLVNNYLNSSPSLDKVEINAIGVRLASSNHN